MFSGSAAGHGMCCGDRAGVFDVAVFDPLPMLGPLGVEAFAQEPVLFAQGVVLVAKEVALTFGAGLGDPSCFYGIAHLAPRGFGFRVDLVALGLGRHDPRGGFLFDAREAVAGVLCSGVGFVGGGQGLRRAGEGAFEASGQCVVVLFGIGAGLFGGGNAAGGFALDVGDFAVDGGWVGEVCEQVGHVGSDGGELGTQLGVAVQQRRQGGFAVGDRSQRRRPQVELGRFAVEVSAVAQCFLGGVVGVVAVAARGAALSGGAWGQRRVAAGELAQAFGWADRCSGDGFQHMSSIPIHSISFRRSGRNEMEWISLGADVGETERSGGEGEHAGTHAW
ncbi:hypothetical protein [Nocardia abscessus]|uniref:hypothetical protein n=1 Tax=Nocardia abscessus TaxID=120957 RepID=UPI0012FCCC5C|nr:hypothetical protein [Nocardia abscessus]MCC3328218.1 hypothetical protein [Nocardia abscessus]